MGVSLLLMALTTYALVIECLEQPVWLVAHIPGLNSVSYNGAMAFAVVVAVAYLGENGTCVKVRTFNVLFLGSDLVVRTTLH